jgi:hypothetical protein
MSKSNAWETALLQLVFNNDNAANIGDATGLRGSTTAGSLYVSLHTGDPGEAGNQTTNECAYTSYARVAVARTTGGWTVSGNAVTNAALIQFPQCTGSSETATHFGIGTASTSTGVLLYKGALSASLAISSGIQPQFGAGELDGTED